jgi:Lipocalin-like domain
MRKLYYLLLLSFLFASCNQNTVKSKLVGTWSLDGVEGHKLDKGEKETKIVFKEDNTVEQKRGKKSKAGKWKLSNDNKSVILDMAQGRDETLNIVVLDQNNFVFTADKGKEKITFIRE